jgi:hypothetical protein
MRSAGSVMTASRATLTATSEPGTPHRQLREARPEPARSLPIGGSAHCEAVHAAADPGQQSGQQHERAEQRAQHGEDPTEREATHQGHGHDQQHQDAHEHRDAGDPHRAARRQHGGGHRLDDRSVAGQLLAEALHHEQRIVDRQPEPEEGADRQREDRHLHELRDEARQRRRKASAKAPIAIGRNAPQATEEQT